MEQSSKAKLIFTLFALILFFCLLAYIGVWVVNLFKQSSAYSDQTTKAVLKCNDYEFDIYDIETKEEGLFFTFKLGESSRNIKGFTIEYETRTRDIEKEFLAGDKSRFGIPNFEESQFSVYIKGCRSFRKTCDALTGVCT